MTQVIASLEVTPGTSTLVSFGATVQLTATPKDANGNPVAGQTATWSSSNNGIATVSDVGLVTAVANGGPVTITATVGAFTGTATATVAQVVATVVVTPGVTTLIALGSTVQLTAAAQRCQRPPGGWPDGELVVLQRGRGPYRSHRPGDGDGDRRTGDSDGHGRRQVRHGDGLGAPGRGRRWR